MGSYSSRSHRFRLTSQFRTKTISWLWNVNMGDSCPQRQHFLYTGQNDNFVYGLHIFLVAFWMLIISLCILEPRNTLLKAGNNLLVKLFSTEASILLQCSLYQAWLIMVINLCYFSLCTFLSFSAKAFGIPTKPAITGKRSEQNKKYFYRGAGFHQKSYKDKIVTNYFWMCLSMFTNM